LRTVAAPSRAATVLRSIRSGRGSPRAASAPHAGGSRGCARPDAARPASRCSRQYSRDVADESAQGGGRVVSGRCDRREVSRVVRDAGRREDLAPRRPHREGNQPRPAAHRASIGADQQESQIQRPPGGRAGAPRATRTVGLAFTTRRRRASATCPAAARPPTFPSIPAARPWPVRPPPARARPALRRGTVRRRAAAPRPPRRGCARRPRTGRTPARRPDTSSRRR